MIVEPPIDKTRDLTAILVTNRKRLTGDSDLYGTIIIGEVEYLMRAWHRCDTSGERWIKVRLLRLKGSAR